MRSSAFVAFAVLGTASVALSQSLPQSSPSPDWAAFGPDAGSPSPSPVAPPPPGLSVPPPPPATSPDALSDPGLGAIAPAPVVTKQTTIETEPRTPSTSFHIGDPRNARLTSNLDGPVGVYKVISAEPGTPGVLRFSLTGAYFQKNDFPVVNSNVTREAGMLTLGFTPVQFLDLYIGTRVSATNSSGSHGTNPPFVSELGDFWGGIKLGGYVVRGFALALDFRGQAFSGVGNNDVAAGAFLGTGALTLDFNRIGHFPLRFHLNAGGRYGSMADIGKSAVPAGVSGLRAPEQFALDATNYNLEFRGAAGLELTFPFVTPFVEYNAIFPVGFGANALLDPHMTPVNYFVAFPNDLDFGLRLTAFKDVSFIAGGDFSFQQSIALGIPIQPAWEAFLGVSYNADLTAGNRTTVIESTRAAEAVPTGIVSGVVLDLASGAPISEAIVSTGVGQNLVATDATGHFVSYPLPAGPIDLTVTREGYRPGSGKAVVVIAQPANVEIRLEREVKAAPSSTGLHVAVHSGSKPIAATVVASGPSGFTQQLKLGADGQGQINAVGPGAYLLSVTAEGYLGQIKHVDVAATGGSVELDLQRQPKRNDLIFSDKKIRLKRQIHFRTGRAGIQTDSGIILDELVDAIVTRGINRIRVEGHTDNVGGKAKNLRLSQGRADAVMQFLIQRGIPPERIEAVGYGDSKPIAPNLTARGRALNRRVEFDIL